MTLRRLLPLMIALGITACGSDKSVAPPPTVATVVVTPGSDTLWTLGRTRQFVAQPRDANGNPVSGITVAWQSSNPAVATVDNTTGIVTAVGNGLTVISAHASGIVGQANLAVAQVVATVQVTPASVGLTTVGVSQQFTAVAKDSGGATVPGVRYLWGSSNPAVATVDTLGLATTRGSGQTTISATGRGVPGYGVVTVNQVAASLVFVARPDSASAGEPFPRAVQVEIRDSGGALVVSARHAVTLTVQTTYGSLSGALTVGAVGGVVTFSNVVYSGLEGTYALRAAAAGFDTVSSTGVKMKPGVADTLIYSTGAHDGKVGDTLPDVMFTLYDHWGNFARTDTAVVHLFVDSSDWGPHVYGPNAVVPSGGTATFRGIVLDRPSVGIRFAATVRRVKSAPSRPFFFDTMPEPVTVLDAHGNHTCAVFGARAFCWGSNYYSEGGNGDSTSDSVPVLVRTDQHFTKLGVGHDHSCGLTAAGAAWCWGLNLSGQVGIPASQREAVPVAVGGGLTFDTIASGYAFSCGLTGAGDAYCWGDNSLGQLGNGQAVGTGPLLVSGGHTYSSLSVGEYHACAIAAGGTLYCWGRNEVGELGVGFTSAFVNVPTLVQGGLVFTNIAAGDRHTCGLLADSSAYCWGFGGNGELGDSTTATDSAPGPVYGAHKFVAIASGSGSCGIDPAHFLWCWGVRQEVDGFQDRIPINQFPASLFNGNVTIVIMGSSHQCFRTVTFSDTYCYGSNGSYQFGNGSRTIPSLFPKAVVTR